jgi:hypothetical protein
MPDRPILFSAPMVRALLDGRKTQTRRVAAFVQEDGDGWHLCNAKGGMWGADEDDVLAHGVDYAPYAVGDRLYVRESYYQRGHWWKDETDLTAKGKPKWKFAPYDHEITFEAPTKFLKARSRTHPAGIVWYKRLGRFMPRRYSRLTLAVTDVGVERLQDISEADAIAEGVVEYEPTMEDPAEFSAFEGSTPFNNAVSAYRDLWNAINSPGAWDANPWVAAVSFTVEQRNIDGYPVAPPLLPPGARESGGQG